MLKRTITLLVLICLTSVFAHSAEIRGRVYDSINTLYLEGARVTIVETGSNTISSRSGFFSFGGLDAGEYTVSVSAVGYPPASEVVTLTQDQNLNDLIVNIGDDLVFDLEEFAVTGSVVGTAKALNQQRTSNSLQNIVSSDAFGQFVDRTAAESLQRLPGVAVEDSQGEGKFLLIRGADPSWSTVTIDGVELATPEENGRSIGLNIITVDQLESIEVTKSWTPDKKAGFVGGNVNMKTRSALDSGKRFASIEGAYGMYDIADTGSWRGSITYGDVFNIGKKAIAFQVSINQSEDNRGSDTLALGWSIITDYPLKNSPAGIILTSTNMDDYRITRERLGVSSKLEFLIAPGHIISGSVSFNSFDDKEVQQRASISSGISPVNFRGNQRITNELALELGLDPNDPAVFSRINSVDNWGLYFDEAIALGEVAFDEDSSTYTYSEIWEASIGRQFQHIETNDEITTYSLSGTHSFTPYLKADWKAYNTEAEKTNEELELRFGGRGLNAIPVVGESPSEVYQMLPDDQLEFFLDPASFYISRTLGTFGDYKYNSSDKRSGGDIDLTWIKEIKNVTVSTKVGASYDTREKEYSRDYQRLSGEKVLDPEIYPDNEMRLNLVDLYAGNQDDFLYDYGPNYQFGPTFDDERMLAFLADPEAYGVDFGVPKPSDVNYTVTNATLRDYIAEENILGVYLMETLEYKGWTLILGIRWEDVENGFTNNEILTRTETGAFIRPSIWRFLPLENYARPVESTKAYDHMLPAVHLKKTFGSDWVFRASATQTLARPLFTDLVPREIPSISSAGLFSTTLQLPNFDLQPMESTNYDFSLQRYFEDVGYFNLSAFYKDLDGAIYSETRQIEPGDETRPYAEKYNSLGNNNSLWTFDKKVNSGAGKLYGVEIAFDRNFDFLGDWAEDFGFSTNVAVMESEVTLTTYERLGEKVPLFKQPDSTFNFSLFYETKKIFARLSYNLRGNYLRGVTGGLTAKNLANPNYVGQSSDALDTYVDEYGKLDFNIRWKVTKNFQVFAEITNITNEPIKEYRGDEMHPAMVRFTGPIFFMGGKWNL